MKMRQFIESRRMSATFQLSSATDYTYIVQADIVLKGCMVHQLGKAVEDNGE